MKELLFITLLIFTSCLAMAQPVPDSMKIVQEGWNYYQNDFRLRDRDIREITSKDPLAVFLMDKAQTYNVLGYVVGIGGGFCMGYPVVSYMLNKKTSWTMLYVGAALVVLTIPTTILYYRAKNKAIRTYNQGISKASTTKLDFKLGLTGNGIGMAMRF